MARLNSLKGITMSKTCYTHAASIVSAIAAGGWTHEPPVWAERYCMAVTVSDERTNYIRAVQTAEAFAALFMATDAKFGPRRFLRACGLA